MVRFGPGLRGGFGDLGGGHLGQAGEDVAQVGQRVEAPAAAAFDDGVEDGGSLACVGGSDEEPVFLAYRGGADGVFDSVVVDLDAPVGEEAFEGGPLLEGVGDGAAHCALREVTCADALHRGVDAAQDHGALCGAHGMAQTRAGSVFAQLVFDLVKVADLAEQPGAGARGGFAGFDVRARDRLAVGDDGERLQRWCCVGARRRGRRRSRRFARCRESRRG